MFQLVLLGLHPFCPMVKFHWSLKKPCSEFPPPTQHKVDAWCPSFWMTFVMRTTFCSNTRVHFFCRTWCVPLHMSPKKFEKTNIVHLWFISRAPPLWFPLNRYKTTPIRRWRPVPTDRTPAGKKVRRKKKKHHQICLYVKVFNYHHLKRRHIFGIWIQQLF